MDSCVILEPPHEGHPWWKCCKCTYVANTDLGPERRMDSCVIDSGCREVKVLSVSFGAFWPPFYNGRTRAAVRSQGSEL